MKLQVGDCVLSLGMGHEEDHNVTFGDEYWGTWYNLSRVEIICLYEELKKIIDSMPADCQDVPVGQTAL